MALNSGQLFPRTAAAVTKSDVTTYSGVVGVYVGTTGDVAIKFGSDSTAVTHKSVPAGTTIVGDIRQVMSTNTTASDFILYFC